MIRTLTSSQKGKKIAIKQRDSVQLCDIDKITYLECNSYITTVHQIDENPLSVAKLLKDFENDLIEFGFIRVNRSELVNLAHVRKYSGGSKRILELTNGYEINVSRRNVFKIKEYMLK